MEYNTKGIEYFANKVFGSSISGFEMPRIVVNDNGYKQMEPRKGLSEDEIACELDKMRAEYEQAHPNDKFLPVVKNLTGSNAKGYLQDYLLTPNTHFSAELQDFMRKERKLFSKKKNDSVFVVKYIASSKTVEIYRDFIDVFDDPDEQIDAFRSALAEGVFYAMLHYVAPKLFADRTKNTRTVREALSSYCLYMFLNDKKAALLDDVDYSNCKNKASRMYGFWYDYLFQNESAKACLFHCEDEAAKFHRVLNTSMTDVHKAYEELVPEQLR